MHYGQELLLENLCGRDEFGGNHDICFCFFNALAIKVKAFDYCI